PFPGRRSQQNRGICRGALAHQRLDSLEKWLGFHHHSLAAAKWTVIHTAMTVMREVAQVMNLHFDEPRFARAPQDPVLERPRKKLGKNRDEIKAHDVALSA